MDRSVTDVWAVNGAVGAITLSFILSVSVFRFKNFLQLF